MELMKITISTDGACSGNPGPGGYAALLRFGEHSKEVAGYESHTTNNRMELRAVIEGMLILKKPCEITVRTDSQTVCNAIANLDSMPVKGWKTKTGAKRANCDLLQQMLKLKQDGKHVLRYMHVKGHSGDPDNERCNTLAQEQISRHAR